MDDDGRHPERRDDAEVDAAPTVQFLGRRIRMPRSRLVRMPIGVLLVVFGFLGFLPVLGFWMVPAGLLVLSYDIAMIRRWRRRMGLWWGRRRRTGGPRR